METPFEKLTELALDSARTTLIGTKGQQFGDPEDSKLLTIFHLIKRDGSHDIIGTPWRNDKEKREAVLAICLQAIETDAIAFSFMSEVWTAVGTKEEYEQNRRIGPPPRERPDRKEAVVCLMGDAKEIQFKSWTIQRDENRICTALVENTMEGAKISSWIADALQRAVQLNEAGKGMDWRKKIQEWPK